MCLPDRSPRTHKSVVPNLLMFPGIRINHCQMLFLGGPRKPFRSRILTAISAFRFTKSANSVRASTVVDAFGVFAAFDLRFIAAEFSLEFLRACVLISYKTVRNKKCAFADNVIKFMLSVFFSVFRLKCFLVNWIKAKWWEVSARMRFKLRSVYVQRNKWLWVIDFFFCHRLVWYQALWRTPATMENVCGDLCHFVCVPFSSLHLSTQPAYVCHLTTILATKLLQLMNK